MLLGCWVTERAHIYILTNKFLIFGLLSYIVGYIKQAEKIGKNLLFLPPMRGSHLGTQVQF